MKTKFQNSIYKKKNQQTKILFIIEEIKKKIFYFFAIYFQSQNIKFL